MSQNCVREEGKAAKLGKEFIMMTLGTALVSIGVYFFKFPNNFSMGGVSGLAVLLGELVHVPGLTPSVFNSIINILFLILGFIFLNRSFGFKTVYCSLLYAGLTQLFEILVPLSGPLTSNKMLEAFFAIILPALGSGILFNLNASTGGTDIAAMILKKFSGLDVGRALLISDIVIAAAALFIFDIETGLFSLLGLVLKSVLVDSVIESLNRRKSMTIITSKPDVAVAFITETLHRGATVWEGQGAYTQEKHWVVLTVLSRGQAVVLRRHLKEKDPGAFLLVSNSSEIFGKGFLRA
ncbi:MAG TPA: YitT family protein [Candidatus Galloscillospira stercoripullorum]|nr:YitT family protein [Candidatus Galloscillospira stercoripullorum]